jgi:hypothetical protein
MNFEELVHQIEFAHKELQSHALRQVNNALTMRNILIGYYMVEYEQHGSDRAHYGQETIKSLAQRLKHIRGISKTQLYRFRDFYLSYPAIFATVLGKLQRTNKEFFEIFPTVSGILPEPNEEVLSVEPEELLNRLSFSHFIELLNIDDPLKRAFYEIQTVKNNWGANGLQRNRFGNSHHQSSAGFSNGDGAIFFVMKRAKNASRSITNYKYGNPWDCGLGRQLNLVA